MAQSEVGYIFPEDAAKQVVDVGKAIQNTDAQLIKYTEDAAKLIALLKEQNISFEKLQKVKQKTVETTQKLDAIGNQLIQSETKLKQVTDTRTEQIIKNKLETAKATQVIKEKLKANEAEEGSLVRMRIKLKELTEAYDKSGNRTKKATKEINNLSREIGKAEEATNRHQRGVGGYADQLGNLPGPLGSVTAGLVSTGKAMWALVANPIGAVIAAIALALGGLYKAFTATDSGAVKLEGVFKAISNVTGVLIDRLESFYSMLWNIVTFDFKGVKEDAKDTFGGIGSQLSDAAKSGYQLAKVLDDINDREAASQVTIERLRDEYRKLYIAARDPNITAQARIRLTDLAMAKETEANQLEVKYQKERTAATKNDLATRIQDNKMTIEGRQEMLEQWVMMDEKQMKSEEAKGGAFAKFVDKNEAAFQELQKMYADTISKERELNEKTTRLQVSKFGLIKQINDESKAAAERKAAADEKAAAAEKKQSDERIKQWVDEVIAKMNAENEKIEANEKYQSEFAEQMDSELDLVYDKLDKEVSASIAAGEKILAERVRLAEDEAKRKEEISKAIEDGAFETASMLSDELTNRRIANIEKEFQVLEMQKEAELANKNLTDKQKQQIEEKYAKKAAELKTKQAKAEKQGAIFSSIINTAAAFVKALPNIPLAIIAGAMGLIQTGIIMARPIPKFAKGTDYAPDEFIAGESGREIIKTKTGERILANKATYFKGNRFKGATIYSNSETEQIIKGANENNNFIFDTKELRDEIREVKNAIVRKPVLITDKSGNIIGKQTTGYREIYLEKLRNGR